MPSLLHIPQIILNAVVTLQPMTKYSTLFLFVLFSIPLLLLFFSTIPLPPLAFVYAHFFVFPFPCYSL
jgi:hypothetical protein